MSSPVPGTIYAERLARRAGKEVSSTDKQIVRCYKHTLNRPPTPVELAAARELAGPAGQHLADLCLALFNINEFLHLD